MFSAALVYVVPAVVGGAVRERVRDVLLDLARVDHGADVASLRAQACTSHHITSHHITSHHITSHHITSHHITSHHITSYHTDNRLEPANLQ